MIRKRPQSSFGREFEFGLAASKPKASSERPSLSWSKAKPSKQAHYALLACLLACPTSNQTQFCSRPLARLLHATQGNLRATLRLGLEGRRQAKLIAALERLSNASHVHCNRNAAKASLPAAVAARGGALRLREPGSDVGKPQTMRPDRCLRRAGACQSVARKNLIWRGQAILAARPCR